MSTAVPLLADASGYEALPEGCSHLIDTTGPPGVSKRVTALFALAVALYGFWHQPLLAGCALAVVLVVDLAVLVRFRRHDPHGPRDQQVMFCPWTQHAVTLLRLRDPVTRDRVLAAALQAADGEHTRLVFAGQPQLNSSRSPKLTGELGKDEPTPWHLFLITEHCTGDDYSAFSEAAGLKPDGENSLVHTHFVTGFKPPTRLIYLILPLAFDVVGVMVRLADLLLGRAPRAALVRGGTCQEPKLQALVQFVGKRAADPAWASQPYIMFNIMKPAESAEDAEEDKKYMIKQLLMFASALRIRPFMVHMGSTNSLTQDGEKPWFEQTVCMFHPSSVWMHRLLNSTLFLSGAQKKLLDMETILILPLDITSQKAIGSH